MQKMYDFSALFRAIPRYSALLALVLFANSCSKDSPVTESEITPDPIFSMMATDSPPDEATNPRVRPQVDKCDCFIRFEEIRFVVNGQVYNGNYIFRTSTNVSCPDVNGCGVSQSFYSNSNCPGSAGGCETDESQQDPLLTMPFNCLVERNGSTSYTVDLDGRLPEEPCTGFDIPIDYENSFISFRIVCAESQPDPNCRAGQGYSFVSDLFVVDNLQESFFDNWEGSFQFEMGGECGCTAIEL